MWVKRHSDRWRNHLKKTLGILLIKDVERAHLATTLDAMVTKGIRVVERLF